MFPLLSLKLKLAALENGDWPPPALTLVLAQAWHSEEELSK